MVVVSAMGVVMVMPTAAVVVGMCLGVVMVAVAIIGHMAAVSTAFGLKRQISFHHGHVHAAQHVGQHMVGFNFQVVGLQLDGHMAVAQVVGGAHQVKGRAMRGAGGDLQHALGRGNRTDQRAVFGHQHVAAAHGLAARQKDGQFAALAVGGGKARLLAHVPVQLDGGGALQQHFGQALALGQEFVDGQHRLLSKGELQTGALCAFPSAFLSNSMTNMSTPSELSRSDKSGWQPCGVGHVAVYGTLRAGAVNDIARLRGGMVITGRTTLTGTLHDLGWYPGLVLQGTQQVLAEVYPLDAALEQVLDGYEGIWPQDTGEYTKRTLTVPVALTGGGTQMLAVLVYEALPATVQAASVIDSGDWLAWFKAHKTAPGA